MANFKLRFHFIGGGHLDIEDNFDTADTAAAYLKKLASIPIAELGNWGGLMGKKLPIASEKLSDDSGEVIGAALLFTERLSRITLIPLSSH